MPSGKMFMAYKGNQSRSGGLTLVKRKSVPKAVKTYVSKRLNQAGEHKYWDAILGSTSMSITGQITNVTSAISQGDGYNNRTGDQIKALALEFRFTTLPSIAQTALQLVRFILLQDNGSTGAGTPVVSDVLQSVSIYAGINATALEAKRFRILSDRMLSIGYYVGDPNNGGRLMVKRKLNHVINWTTTGTGSRGQIYCLVLTDNASGAAALYNWGVRLVFTDL